MIVCLCEGISDKEVRRCIVAGACSLRQIRKACGAGSGCGLCRPFLRQMIEIHGAIEKIKEPAISLANKGAKLG